MAVCSHRPEDGASLTPCRLPLTGPNTRRLGCLCTEEVRAQLEADTQEGDAA